MGYLCGLSHRFVREDVERSKGHAQLLQDGDGARAESAAGSIRAAFHQQHHRLAVDQGLGPLNVPICDRRCGGPSSLRWSGGTSNRACSAVGGQLLGGEVLIDFGGQGCNIGPFQTMYDLAFLHSSIKDVLVLD